MFQFGSPQRGCLDGLTVFLESEAKETRTLGRYSLDDGLPEHHHHLQVRECEVVGGRGDETKRSTEPCTCAIVHELSFVGDRVDRPSTPARGCVEEPLESLRAVSHE